MASKSFSFKSNNNNHIKSIVLSSGLFDEYWYKTRYSISEDHKDPLEHFLESGWSSRFSPGPLFDTSRYLIDNPDVGDAGLNPLLHYLQFGVNEGRVARSVNLHDFNNSHLPSDPLYLSAARQEIKSLVVAVHVFYLDVFDEICRYLNNITQPYTLLITTPNTELVPEIQRRVSSLTNISRFRLAISQNRGRNFAPMLVEFRNEIINHEILLHLHTKKSLFTGHERADWRSHLFNSIVGGRLLTNTIITKFSEDKRLGVVYPSTSIHQPYWAHTWLSNAHIGPHFMARMGVPPETIPHYFDFPMGSMFWARTDALAPILSKVWTYDDFPPELGQNDGTIQHVLERSIVLVARSRRYTTLEINYENGSILYNQSGKNLSSYMRKTRWLSDYIRNSCEIVSFDIFDTLLVRPSLRPDSIQKYVGFLLENRDIRRKDFFGRRKDAEFRARQAKNFSGDVDIYEIYQCFPRDKSWTKAAIDEALRLEIETELRLTRPRQAVVDLLLAAKRMGKRVILVSDTYLPRSAIESMLEKIGVLAKVDALYISSEQGRRKDRGDMWDFLKVEEFQKGAVIHIGDNEQSDVQTAGDRGVTTYHVMAPTTLIEQCGLRTHLKSWTSDILLGPISAKFGRDPFIERSFAALELKTAKDVGYFAFGPLIFGFIAWLIQHPLMRAFNQLFFLAREGYFLKDIYDLVASLTPLKTLPASRYFYGSRASLLPAALASGAPASLAVRAGAFNGTFDGFFQSRLGCPPPPGFSLGDDKISLPNDQADVERILGLISGPLREQLQSTTFAARAYVESVGMVSGENVAVVDIGYSATIQRALQWITGRSLTGFYMATSREAVQVHAEGGHAFGYCGEWLEHPLGDQSPLFLMQGLAEAYLTAPHGQVRGYEVRGEDILARFKAGSQSQRKFDVLKEIHSGVREYVEDLFQAYGPEVCDLTLDPVAAQEPFRMLTQNPVRVPGRVAAALSLEDDFCGNQEIEIGNQQLNYTRIRGG